MWADYVLPVSSWCPPFVDRGQVPEAFASERGLKTTNCLRGKVRDRRGRARLDDVEVEPRLQHELELFFPVRDGEVTRAVGHG